MSETDPIGDLRQQLMRVTRTRDIRIFYRDEEYLRALLTESINRDPLFLEAVDVLSLCLRNLRGHPNIHLWSQIVTDALMTAMDLGNRTIQIEVYLMLGNFVLREGQPQMALKAAEFVLRDKDTQPSAAVELRAYLLLLRAEAQRGLSDLQPAVIVRSLELADQIGDDLDLVISLYCALAMIYLHQLNFSSATHYVRRAYNMSRRLGSMQRQLDCMVISAAIARNRNRMHRVLQVVKLVEHYVSTDEDRVRYAYFLYESGSAFLQANQPQESVRLLTEALELFELLKMKFMIASTQQALGLALGDKGDIVNARRYLRAAWKTWNALHYRYGQVDIRIAASYIARQQKRFARAACLLARASSLLSLVLDTKRRSWLAVSIDTQAQYIINEWGSTTQEGA